VRKAKLKVVGPKCAVYEQWSRMTMLHKQLQQAGSADDDLDWLAFIHFLVVENMLFLMLCEARLQ
jgi:hypothetical protein